MESVLRGRTSPWQYPSLDFGLEPGMSDQRDIRKAIYLMRKKGTFIGWVLENTYYTYCQNIFLWIEGDKKMDWVCTKEELIQAMKADTSDYFVQRHYNKVEHVYQMYLERTSV